MPTPLYEDGMKARRKVLGDEYVDRALGNVDVDVARRFEDIEVSRLVLFPPAFDPDGLKKGLNDCADQVISKL